MVVREEPVGFALATSLKSGGMWGIPMALAAPNEPFLFTTVLGIGTPTEGSVRRMMINVGDGIHEVRIEGLAATTVGTYGSKDLGFTFMQAPNLTSDGLRAVGFGLDDTSGADPQVFYLERTSLDLPFETFEVLDSAPSNSDVFMTSNCARVYASGTIGKVLFARQL
jgi:hypothetical protein